MGRVFLRGALAHLSPDVDDVDAVLDDLLFRDLVLHEERAAISGEQAFKFKHVLIREVAYAGLSKGSRADLHLLFADWLRERAGEELVEILAFHLDQATRLLAELDGAAPADLAEEAAAELDARGPPRALARVVRERAQAPRAGGRARADARAALLRRAGGLASRRHDRGASSRWRRSRRPPRRRASGSSRGGRSPRLPRPS